MAYSLELLGILSPILLIAAILMACVIAMVVNFNVVRLEPNHPYDHLSVADAEHIITELKPKVAILTHFGMTMWQAKPWQIAQRLSQQTGVRVLAARDGMRFDLSQLG